MKLSSVLSNYTSFCAVIFVTACGFSSQAQAQAFSGSVSGTWGEPTPGSINTDPVYTGVGTNTFTWGEEYQFSEDQPATPPNKLIYQGSSFSTNLNSLFKLGNLTYFNGTVPQGTNVESVPLNLNLSFDKFNSAINLDYMFELMNTPNDSSKTDEENADYMFVSNSQKRNFSINGTEYTFTLAGFMLENSNKTLSEFRVLEGKTSTAAIVGRITSAAPATIPEPATVSGLSLLSIYLISRKKTQK